jgi:hypothetical protein
VTLVVDLTGVPLNIHIVSVNVKVSLQSVEYSLTLDLPLPSLLPFLLSLTQDGEIGVVRASDTTLDTTVIQTAPEHDVLLTPDPYPHFTIKECLEQPEAIARVRSVLR